MSAGDAVRVERQGAVTTVILHRPEARNAVDRPAADDAVLLGTMRRAAGPLAPAGRHDHRRNLPARCRHRHLLARCVADE